MTENNQSAKILIAAFVNEATLAADMVLSEITGLEVPDEVIEAVKETKALADKAAGYDNKSISALNDFNWQMHIICSKLYLNIQRVSRNKRERFSNAISAYKTMMYHFSMGQMQLAPIIPGQLVRDMGYHTKILGDSAQAEINRLLTFNSLNEELAGLSEEIDRITSLLTDYLAQDNQSGNSTQGIKSIAASFAVITDTLQHTAELLGEQGDTLNYLAEEYDFFKDKIGDMSELL